MSAATVFISFQCATQVDYWLPSMTFVKAPTRTLEENQNFEPEPRDQTVAIDLVHASKASISRQQHMGRRC